MLVEERGLKPFSGSLTGTFVVAAKINAHGVCAQEGSQDITPTIRGSFPTAVPGKGGHHHRDLLWTVSYSIQSTVTYVILFRLCNDPWK